MHSSVKFVMFHCTVHWILLHVDVWFSDVHYISVRYSTGQYILMAVQYRMIHTGLQYDTGKADMCRHAVQRSSLHVGAQHREAHYIKCMVQWRLLRVVCSTVKDVTLVCDTVQNIIFSMVQQIWGTQYHHAAVCQGCALETRGNKCEKDPNIYVDKDGLAAMIGLDELICELL